MKGNICKHFMYGYCKLQEHCPKQHIDVLCPSYRECDDNGCVLRHPNACKYFARYKKCKFVECAYSHETDENGLKIKVIEDTNIELKYQIEDLKKTYKEKLDMYMLKLKPIQNKSPAFTVQLKILWKDLMS